MTQRFGKGLSKPSQVRARENLQPTTAQLAALQVFARLVEKNGKSPTKREVSKALGLSESGAQKHLEQLTAKGLLEEERELVVVGRRLSEQGRKWLASLAKSSS